MSDELDVRLEITPGRTIIESFAGVSETQAKAIGDALTNFTANSFHVLLAAFFQPEDQEIRRDEWVIGGMKSRVTIGNVGVRGTLPRQGDPMFAWFKRFEESIKCERLRPGIHWARLYYGQMQGRAIACEVLLDNNVWETVASEMAAVGSASLATSSTASESFW